MTPIILALIANSIAHIISFIQLNKVQDPNSKGVLVFVFVNAIIALLLWQQFDWAKWLALIFPLLGGLALLIGLIAKGKAKWIDYVIIILDISVICLVILNLLNFKVWIL